MDDLISRQAAIDYFVTNVGFHDEDGYSIEDECELREIWTGYFDGIPSAQLPTAEPKRGKWINYDSDSEISDDIRCSCCRKLFTVDTYHFTDIGFIVDDLKYCPNCGARMED